jgi:hypothetical protein
MSRLGDAHPVSTKLRCRVEIPALTGEIELAQPPALAQFAQ